STHSTWIMSMICWENRYSFFRLMLQYAATARKVAFGSLGRKRLCRLRLQLGARLGLSLNFQVLEILPVTHAVAENLLLAGQIGRRAEDIFGAIPGRCLHGKRRIGQMGTPKRHQVGAARGQYRIDLIGGG